MHLYVLPGDAPVAVLVELVELVNELRLLVEGKLLGTQLLVSESLVKLTLVLVLVLV